MRKLLITLLTVAAMFATMAVTAPEADAGTGWQSERLEMCSVPPGTIVRFTFEGNMDRGEGRVVIKEQVNWPKWEKVAAYGRIRDGSTFAYINSQHRTLVRLYWPTGSPKPEVRVSKSTCYPNGR